MGPHCAQTPARRGPQTGAVPCARVRAPPPPLQRRVTVVRQERTRQATMLQPQCEGAGRREVSRSDQSIAELQPKPLAPRETTARAGRVKAPGTSDRGHCTTARLGSRSGCRGHSDYRCEHGPISANETSLRRDAQPQLCTPHSGAARIDVVRSPRCCALRSPPRFPCVACWRVVCRVGSGTDGRWSTGTGDPVIAAHRSLRTSEER